jgi:molybdopterin biosynthesis enzyme MoaB
MTSRESVLQAAQQKAVSVIIGGTAIFSADGDSGARNKYGH